MNFHAPLIVAISMLSTSASMASSIYKCKGKDGRYTYQESRCTVTMQNVPVLDNRAGNSTVSSERSATDQLKDMQAIRGTGASQPANAVGQNPFSQGPSWGQRKAIQNNKDDVQDFLKSMR